MDISKAFNETLNCCGISAKWLASESGVSEVMISRFRNGKQVQSDTLGKLVTALPVAAKYHFFESLLGDSLQLRCQSLEELVEAADDDQTEKVMMAIARKWRRLRKSVEQANSLLEV